MYMSTFFGSFATNYNICYGVYRISKLCLLIVIISFSFQELREVRVAFQLYEHEDMLGLVIDEHVLLRTLKVSNMETTA